MTDPTPVQSPRSTSARGVAIGLATGLVLGAGAMWALRPKPQTAAADSKAAAKAYQCPMHPQILQDHPGACPICGMDLVIMEGTSAPQSPGPEGMLSVQISTERQQLMGLKKVAVEEASHGGELRLNGRVAVDERRVHKLAVRVEGYVERLHADSLGRPVRKGEPLMELMSPDYSSAQREYLGALKTWKEFGNTDQGPVYKTLADTARRRLVFLGADAAQVERLEQTGLAQNLIVASPMDGIITAKTVNVGSKVAATEHPLEITDLSSIWVWADLYEAEAGRVKPGTAAQVKVPALGGRTFPAKVTFLDPALNPQTRVLRARLELANPGLLLRPEMLVEVLVQTETRKGLWIPQDALLDSGTARIAFVDVGNGYFEPREVKTGQSSGGKVEILDGLKKGEAVVAGATFLVDSESRLQAALAQMSAKSAPAEPKH
jgi:Cu(I)/Ag(I) efflux system membrane fusion protein